MRLLPKALASLVCVSGLAAPLAIGTATAVRWADLPESIRKEQRYCCLAYGMSLGRPTPIDLPREQAWFVWLSVNFRALERLESENKCFDDGFFSETPRRCTESEIQSAIKKELASPDRLSFYYRTVKMRGKNGVEIPHSKRGVPELWRGNKGDITTVLFDAQPEKPTAVVFPLYHKKDWSAGQPIALSKDLAIPVK